MSTERYRHICGSGSTINYHFVWCPKYRRKVLAGTVAERLKEPLYEKTAELHCPINALEVLPDHLHLFVDCPPTRAPQQLANQFKGYTSRVLRDEFPHLRSRLPSLWSRSYYVGTAGYVSIETIQNYIEQLGVRSFTTSS
ncbi:MAG: IS200/IS605 family transposase [Chloroflexales bacterium]|nr:IS200/IS605 family transposase [Chloroflexales bacterium]